MLMPVACVICKTYGTSLCAQCAKQLTPAENVSIPHNLVDLTVLFSYQGVAKTLISEIKFRNHRDSVGLLARNIVFRLGDPIDFVTWVPTTRQRARARGFDQARLIADAIGRQLGVSSVPTLKSTGSHAQKELTRQQRAAKRFRTRGALSGSFLLVDDVITTGFSMTAAANCLLESGASQVFGAAIAIVDKSPSKVAIHPLRSH